MNTLNDVGEAVAYAVQQNKLQFNTSTETHREREREGDRDKEEKREQWE